jgi:hypothetical protein
MIDRGTYWEDRTIGNRWLHNETGLVLEITGEYLATVVELGTNEAWKLGEEEEDDGKWYKQSFTPVERKPELFNDLYTKLST